MSDRRQGPSARTLLDCLGGKHQNAELRVEMRMELAGLEETPWPWLCLAPCRSCPRFTQQDPTCGPIWRNACLRGDMRQLLLQQAQKKNCATECYALPTCRGLLPWLTDQIEPQAPAWSVVGNATVVRCNFSL